MIDESRLGRAAREMLEAAGWFPGRHVDPTELIEELAAAGFEPIDAAALFLESCWKLHVEHDPSAVIQGGLVRSFTDFDPERVCKSAGVALRCSTLVGKVLYPVGVNSFHMTVYIANDECFYMGVDASVYEYADGISEFFDRLALGARPKLIGNWM